MKHTYSSFGTVAALVAGVAMTASVTAFADEPAPDSAGAAVVTTMQTTDATAAPQPTDCESEGDAPRWPDQDDDGDDC
jgi:hypothetical protein